MAIPKRFSPTQQLTNTSSTHDLKQRVITCLNKLSDRDTHSLATNELEQIVKSLSHDSFSSFLTCIYDTDSSEKTPVRKQCVRLLGILSSTHGEALSPHLSKMVSNIIKRLRDSDSVVRSACVDSVTSMSTSSSSSLLVFLKPLMETMLFEQDYNSQMGSALCLSSAIEASNDPEPAQLQRVLPKLLKLLKSDSFKAKPALLSLFRSVIGVGGSINPNVLVNLIACLVEFLSNDDWAARKAAAEALGKLAVVQKEMLSEFKSSCLVSFESRRFDKVKVVREVMNQMIEAWKDVPGVLDESFPKDNSNGGCSPSSSIGSSALGYDVPKTKRSTVRRSSFPLSNSSSVSSSKKRSPLKSTNKTSTAALHKLDHKKPSEWKIEVSLPQIPSFSVDNDSFKERNEKVQERETNKTVMHSEMSESSHHLKPEKQGIFSSKNSDEKMHNVGRLRPGSRVVPYNDESSESTLSNDSEDQYENVKEREDLSLIRKQLLQIENQQSSLLDLLQRFMGSSQNGIKSLETRVNGLEIALDEIMYELTGSTGRMSPSASLENKCCKLPGADFLSPKFWRKSEGRFPTVRFTSAGSIPSLYHTTEKDCNADSWNLENRRFYHQAGGGGFADNPLAGIHDDLRRNSEVYSNRMPTTIYRDADRGQARNGYGL
ncbi:microtubule-associated protein TORTIFOLIA1-like [Thalictrum thalictroides]|uniref:Microtubule-associated protein TORTIFOLIA1-like n=1 Tax=Thalictrum thalictroides TaxID=46969 RepID=A0A7J6WAD2_THATH|nr:microtubule-associated protein TORTIFOLIA1-like [Thalictrum thalictroides]